ncbi:bifunctional [glutamate--ammonia ligase]-adenylyl-L-tyrosine phosphorylase/[glutamate--ammonia-ligase] adenylyltransferase [Lysobacter sp. GX 14042]|uniref:bifunctional [glutamate--ammonia ligase]-adenylyl-L-tyrosine phosphorylase/[glutamate--ammonia-ligase] adenylyltransferase n=1 Tax=Lysobacter sp. GX 14042 TaxID=2907155 RepID=UPI001F1F03A5|nr:bifunctional [glutamate--ammonia ligase]-adenylyl-L-tyrosine phosphorylase/[glutamate--ammonia-ligase] adenylyltransferase [Lysobacter sp. GX 14042]MCE7033389.1 bifunctional [glutamate--ammonia ligase]-adenylyl-L-tyrosine phosphorylase/[glutamate--ammonia-ligase] adenylyltransferase [Lysobacter sp. GX 14042]
MSLASPEPSLDPLVERGLARLSAASGGPVDDPRVRRVLAASDFVLDTLVRQPGLLRQLLVDDGARPLPVPVLGLDGADGWPALLRRYRSAESARLAWRDINGLDGIADTLAGSTALAEQCLQIALAACEHDFAGRHGVLRATDGTPRRLIVFALGKLGGGELNFSSDVDLVYGYDSDGLAAASDGPRPLAPEPYFSRLGQQLARLLGEHTAEGFCHRVDLRLRPYGSAGRSAWSLAAMELYFQQEGRDWERYAWQKARPVAGDTAAGEAFLAALRPFVYRRYLDFGALEGLRDMKAAVSAEVARRDLADDIKRGPGGIREIEFLVQALQLIRGGREPALRRRGLLPALQALLQAHHIEPEAAGVLGAAYRFLRRLENRLQMLRDDQVHALPEDPLDRLRIARGLDFADWRELLGALEHHRAAVSAEFDALLGGRGQSRAPAALAVYWRALPDAGEPDELASAGFDEPRVADALLRDFARGPGVRGLSDASRARLDRILPALLQGAADSGQGTLALRRLLAMLQNILRRSAYLALLDEQPDALERVLDVVSHSALLAERLAAHPLLLDELLDTRVSGPMPGRGEVLDACARAGAAAGNDVETVLNALNEVRQALGFRIAMALRDGRQGPVESARQLAWLADGVVARVLALAWREMATAHGAVSQARFAVLGYGSLGAGELGFGSDLDLVFLYDAPAGAASDGARPLEAQRWFARLAQKLVALLGATSAAGHLYEVDVRLRPDGAKGLLVSTLARYRDYQLARAWTWEHQALVRARCIAGDPSLCADFEQVRAEVLSRPRTPQSVAAEVGAMRERMRAELDRSGRGDSPPARFDLKHGRGGLVDLEFMLQARVLAHAARHGALLRPRDSTGLMEACLAAGVLDAHTGAALRQAHATLLRRALECSLDRRSRVLVVPDAALVAARAVVLSAAAVAPPPPPPARSPAME